MGSGKSTTCPCWRDCANPSFGQIVFGGRNIADYPVEYKARVGYVPEEANLYSFLSAVNNCN
jgi:ABC-2 type transport system ATP-binding protein